MNRGQAKRLRKELDRLRNGAKEWDALRLIEREKVIDNFRTDWNDMWRSQARHALRTAKLMEVFLAQVKEFSTVPDNADIRFTRFIDDYLDGRDVSSELQGMTGLSAPAETLRRELLRLGNKNITDDEKLRKLLISFATTPEKALQKDYRQLRALLASSPATAQNSSDETLVEMLTQARKLNSAAVVKKKAHGVAETDLHHIDLTLKGAAAELPQPLFSVVALPVLAQISVAIQRVAEKDPNQAARLALAAPFAMERLVGADWSVMKKKFQLEVSHTITTVDRVSLRNAARNATFEERFILIKKLTGFMSSQQDLDEDMQDTLVILYRELFRELAIRRATISERDQRRLAAVLGPVLAKHIPLLYGDISELKYLLDAAAAAGCLDTVGALLHTFFAVMSRDRAMIANAHSMLKILPPVLQKDVNSLIGSKFQIYLVEDLKSMKGMLAVCRECGHDIDAFMANALDKLLLSSLIMNTQLAEAKKDSFMGMLLELWDNEEPLVSKKLIKGIGCFADNPLFSLPVALANSFPSGIISKSEFTKLMQNQIDGGVTTAQSIAYFTNILEMIRNIGISQSNIDLPFGIMPDTDKLMRELLVAGLDPLCGKKSLVVRHETAVLAALVDLIGKYGERFPLERYVLLIANAVAERMLTGEEAARKVHENTTNYISGKKKSGKNRGSRR